MFNLYKNAHVSSIHAINVEYKICSFWYSFILSYAYKRHMGRQIVKNVLMIKGTLNRVCVSKSQIEKVTPNNICQPYLDKRK